jgi:mannose-6-phosphate isomerase-like protein (cupin superfamily)
MSPKAKTKTKAPTAQLIDPLYLMDQQIVSKGSERFGKIVRLKGETILELDRQIGRIKPGPEGLGVAFAKIHDSEPHFHKKTTEYYFVTEGFAELRMGGEKFDIVPNNIAIIPPGVIHSVNADLRSGVKIIVLSDPPHDPKDHFKAKPVSELKRRG